MRSKFWYLVKLSFKRKVKTKWFLVANILIAIVLVGVINLDQIIGHFGGDFANLKTVYVVDDLGIYNSFEQVFSSSMLDGVKNYRLSLVKNEDEVAIDDDSKLLLHIMADNNDYIKASLYSYNDIDTVTRELFSSVLSNLKTLNLSSLSGLSDEMISSLMKPVMLDTIAKNSSNDSDYKDVISMGVILIFIVPCFILITLLVQMIGAEINEEKSSRSMEIIISNVSPMAHFLAKVISATSFVLMQGLLLVLYALIGLLIRFVFGSGSLVDSNNVLRTIDIVRDSGVIDLVLRALPVMLLLFIFSFLAYAVLSGVLASMTTSIEDFQQLQTPLMIILAFGYYLAAMSVVFDGALFIKIMAYIPLLSFLLAPTLYMLQEISLFSLFIITCITGLFTFLIFKYGLRIYKVGILNYSSSKLWRRMFHSLRSNVKNQEN